MMESAFRNHLRSQLRWDGRRRFQESTIQNRISNCKNVERHEGDLDHHFDVDRCHNLLHRLTYSAADLDMKREPNHNVPIDGDIRNGSATLKSAVKLYAEFRQRRFPKALLNDQMPDTLVRNCSTGPPVTPGAW